jgi:adenosine kinase
MDIIVTGSIAYDYLMRFPGRFAEHLLPDQLHQISLSFLVEDMTRHYGGVAANIVYSMGLLGMRPRLMGTAGRDFNDYRQWLESVGVDTSTVRQLDSVFTASFFVNTDLDHNQIASFYSGAMAYAREYSLYDACRCKTDLVVISPNDPEAMMRLAAECRAHNIRFMADPGQQVARFTGADLREIMQGAYITIVNGYEAEIICQKTGMTMEQFQRGAEIVVITQGKRGSHIYTGGERIDVEAFPTENIVDPTGAGDAYRAGLLRGLAAGWPIRLSSEVGSLTATYVLENVGPQSHRFTIAEFVARFRNHFDDGGLLDVLLQSPARLAT